MKKTHRFNAIDGFFHDIDDIVHTRVRISGAIGH